MAVQQASFFCPVCQQQRLFTAQNQVNQVLYLLLTLFSCGLWAIVWLIQNLSYTPRFHCSQCGHSDSYRYLANPNLRSQEAQQKAARATLQGKSCSPSSNLFAKWFSGLTNQSKIVMIGLTVFGVLSIIILGVAVKNVNQKSNTQSNANSTSNNSLVNTTSTPIKVTRSPSDLSSAENLEEAKEYLKRDKGVDKTYASMHLEAIPKTAKEYPEAKRLLAEIKVYFQRLNQQSEPNTRKEIEDELANLAGEDAQLENTLNQYENYEGQAATATKLKALKRKGQIELRRIELERKLKSMPR